jgi:tetratricopeptide (TPR) repeat protein
MRVVQILLTIALIILCSCGRRPTVVDSDNLGKDTNQVKPISLNGLNPRELHDSAVPLADILNDSIDFVRVVEILEMSTQKDSNFFAGYYTKLPFQNIIKDYRGALITAKRLSVLMPSDPSFILAIGESYEKLGDRKKAQKYYKIAADSYKTRLDSSESKDFSFECDKMMYALTLIFGNKENLGRQILKELSDSGSAQTKENVSMFIDKPRSVILIDIGLPIEMIK